MRKNIFLLSLFTFLLTASALRAGNFFRTDDSKILPDTLHVSGRSCNIQVGNLLFDRSVNNASDAVEVETTEASTITLSAGKGANFYCFADEKPPVFSAPILMWKIDNRKNYTFTAKVKLDEKGNSGSDCAGLMLYVNDSFWQKFTYKLNLSGDFTAEAILTEGKSDTKSVNAPGGATRTAWMKLTADTYKVGLYFSTDSVNWNRVDYFNKTDKDSVYLGIIAESPSGNGCKCRFSQLQFENVAFAAMQRPGDTTFSTYTAPAVVPETKETQPAAAPTATKKKKTGKR